MHGDSAQLVGGQELSTIELADSTLGRLLRRMIASTNLTATNAGVSSVGKLPPPPKIDSINIQGSQVGNTITCPSEVLHWTLSHNQSVAKNIRYFSEVDVSNGFTQPHVIDHGTARTGFVTLPTYSSAVNATNKIPTNYFLRSYCQYIGSDPCEPTVLGNFTGATTINMGGTSVTALLPSTGSGTASPQGQQGGAGLGKVLVRPAPRPKRSVGSV